MLLTPGVQLLSGIEALLVLVNVCAASVELVDAVTSYTPEAFAVYVVPVAPDMFTPSFLHW